MPRTQTSKIILCKNIKLDKDYINVLNYTEQQMLALCRSQSCLIREVTGYSFIRNEGTIQTSFTYSECLQANYIAFQNPDYSNKWFFAFIDDIKYISDSNTEIHYIIDAWSTFFSSLTLKQCMVVREHVSNDSVGANTIPEDLDLGNEYKINSHLRDSFNRHPPVEAGVSTYYIVVASTIDLTTDNNVYAGIYDGIPTGVQYFPFQIDYSDPEFSPVDDLARVLYRLAGAIGGSKLDAIKEMFIVPYWLAKDLPNFSVSPKQVFTSITPISALDGYTPVNKKLLTYPYSYILLSNCQGQDTVLKQELWNKLQQAVTRDGITLPAGDMVLQIWGAITPGCSIRAIPENYNGDEIATQNGINLGKYPQINWNSDAFTNWLTENGINIASAGLGFTFGLATGNVAIAGTSAVKGVDLLKSGIQASLAPPETHGNTNNGDIMMAMDENCFHLYRMTIKREMAEKIDKYFTKYGYKVNELKIPNINTRQYFNYIQIANDETIGFGSIPSKMLETINKACRDGVTIWHNHDNIGNYNLNNAIV